MSTILQEAAAGRAMLLPWTIERYRRAIETGTIPEDPAFELIDGFIVWKDRAKAGEDPMTIGDRHRVAVLRVAHSASLFESFACFLQTQQPILLPPASAPEPDGAVVRGSIDDYLEHPPVSTDVSCVIEVADSSLAMDLGPKLRAYAAAGIGQYVVVDLVDDRLIVHEEPSGDTYSQIITLTRGSTVHIRASSGDVAIAVERWLP